MSVAATRFVPAPRVVEQVLEASESDGCIVIVEDRSEAEVRFANNTVTTNGTRRDRTVVAIALREGEGGTAVGIASRSGTGDAIDLLRRAEANAATAPPAEDAAPLVTPGSTGAEADFGDPPVTTNLAGLGDVLTGLGEAFGRARAAGSQLAGFAEHKVSTVYLGSSAGLRLRHVEPTGKLELVGRADGGARSAWVSAGVADLATVRLEELEERLTRRLGWAERKVDLDAGRYEVVLPPDAVADLMVMLGVSTSGREAEEGRSVFSAPGGATRVGESLSPHPFTLRSDPFETGLECTPFLVAPASSQDVSVFDNGLPLERTEWISGGRLERLQYHRAAAARSSVQPAAFINNLSLELPGATSSVEDLVARTDRGLLLTCLWYIREVDPATLLLTGLTRDGVYLVEHGEITGSVNNFRFNESPVDLLAKTVEAGRTERALSREWNEWLNRTAMPSLRVADFNMSSVSPAT
ncbi:MAG TPA: metallopeptidase TldD-related protein [Acidimicrobiales bacterium]|nr:metallopeptidase TldD-related protein [Acidimicrobiales bacterium]